MADVIPFKCWRPPEDKASQVAAAPYDTFSRVEATEEVAAFPLSFLRIDKPAALFGSEVGEYDAIVYSRAKEELDTWYEQGIMVPNAQPLEPTFLIYRLTRDAHTQTGVLACVSVEEYQNGGIKRHENTRLGKEQDRIEHIQALEAHTGPVLLTYPSLPSLDEVLQGYAQGAPPLYDFVALDGVRHELWCVEDATIIEIIQTLFDLVPTLYIADGHHRAAAAARVSENYAEAADNAKTEADYFLAVLFGSSQLEVLDYNRVISDLGGLEPEELLARVSEVMDTELVGPNPYKPTKRGEYGMFVQGNWYALTLCPEDRPDDTVEGLDVALLHSLILAPILGIEDPRTNPRISYVGGIRGLDELAKRASATGGAAFALYPCSLEELFAVADEDRLMPPKSTWFEPKPRSGLAIHRINNDDS